MKKKYEVIIIGAGLAGLSAGKVLNENGVDYLIIEASTRPGGKVLSKQKGGQEFELGPQFVNEDMTEIVNLIEESGMKLSKAKQAPGGVSIDSQNKIIDSILDYIEEAFARDEEEDKTLFDLYEERLDNEHQKKIAESIHAELHNNNPRNISAKYVHGMTDRYVSEKDEATHQASGQLNNIIDYLQDISEGHITFDDPAIVIEKDGRDYYVKTENNKYTSEAVIVASPPTPASRISYSNDIDEHFGEALNSYADGAVIKTTWAYEKPFWYDHEIDGEKTPLKYIVFTEHIGVNVNDSSKENDKGSRLTMFIGGDLARELAEKTQEQREMFATDRLVDVFGKQAQEYITMEQSVWVNDRYYGGGYGEMIKANGLVEAPDLLREPFENFVFANTQISSEYPNFMEGAARSGKRAAKVIVENFT